MSKFSNLNCAMRTAGSCTPAAASAAPKAAPVTSVAMVLRYDTGVFPGYDEVEVNGVEWSSCWALSRDARGYGSGERQTSPDEKQRRIVSITPFGVFGDTESTYQCKKDLT